MLKQTVLALLGLTVLSSGAFADSYTDRLALVQSQYDKALAGDKAAAAFVCRQGASATLKTRFIEPEKQNEACRRYARDIATDPAVYRWFMQLDAPLPHALVTPVYGTLAEAGVYPISKLNYLFAVKLFADQKNPADLSQEQSTRLYRQWIADNAKAGRPGFAGLELFLSTDDKGRLTLPEAAIDKRVDECLAKKDYESLKLFYSRLGRGNWRYVEKKLKGEPTHSSLDIARALTQDELKLTKAQFAAVVRSAVESADAMTPDADYTTLSKIALEVSDKAVQKTLFEKMRAYRIDPAVIAGPMDTATLRAVLKDDFGKDGRAEACLASILLSNDDYAKALDAFETSVKLGFASENLLTKIVDTLFHDAKNKASADDILRAHLLLSAHFFYPVGELGASFERYQLEAFAKAAGKPELVARYWRNKLEHAAGPKERIQALWRAVHAELSTGKLTPVQAADALEKGYQETEAMRFVPVEGIESLSRPSAAQSIGNAFVDSELLGVNCEAAVTWYRRALTGPLRTTAPRDLAAVHQDMGRCYLWAPEGDGLKRNPVQAAKSLKTAYDIVDKENFAVSRAEAPRPARLQQIASQLTDALLAAGDEKGAAAWADKAVKSEFGTDDQVAADTAYTMGYYFETRQKWTQAAAWYERLKDKAGGASDANLANLYFSGKGVKADPVKAASLYTSAFCKAPDAINAGNLALIYAEGKGVKANLSWAYALYNLAGDKRARHGMMLLDQALSPEQRSQAQKLNMRALLCR